MRVGLLAPDVNLGGSTGDVWHVKDLATALARAGCKVDLVAVHPEAWPPPPGVRLIVKPEGGTMRAALTLRSVWGRAPPDVLYERRFSPKLSSVLGKLVRRPYFVEINGVVEDEKSMQGRGDRSPRIVQTAKARIRARLLRSATGIITVTEGLRQVLEEDYAVPRNRIVVVPNGVDTSVFHPIAREEARETIGFTSPGPVAIFVGNLVSWQGVHTLIDAMSHVVAQAPDFRLVIVGDGIERDGLERQARRLGLGNIVRFVGVVSRELVPLWLGAADVAVLPSTLRRNLRIGSSALKFREYLSCGRPVIATNIEGAGPLLEAEGLGLGVPGDDPRALAHALLTMGRNSDLRREMGARARAYAERELSWDGVARQIVAFLEQGTKYAGG